MRHKNQRVFAMNQLDKNQIRRAFNAANKTYNNAADWQKNVGKLLLEYIQATQPNEKAILDLGAGTGYLAHQLQQSHPNNQYIALDIAEKMLSFPKQHLHNTWFICADAESLALSSESVDITLSNMVLHWCHSLTEALKEQYRVLKPEGLLLFSVLGPQSLGALKNAWNTIDDYTHVNTFPSANDIQSSCELSGFRIIKFERHEIKKHYENVYELMHHLKATGAKNASHNRPKGLTGKKRIKQLIETYQNPLCYEIFTVICQK